MNNLRLGAKKHDFFSPVQLNLHLMLFRPNDSRMVVALGECYQKLNRVEEAKKVVKASFTSLTSCSLSR